MKNVDHTEPGSRPDSQGRLARFLLDVVEVVVKSALNEKSAPKDATDCKAPAVDAATKLAAICQERSGLRSELIEVQSSMHKSIFFVVTLAIAYAGVFLEHRAIPDEGTRDIVLFCITQVQYFMAVFVVSLMCAQNIHVGYIRALERKINKLCGEPISLWDAISYEYLFQPNRAFMWSQVIIFIMLLTFFAFAGAISLKAFRPLVYRALIGAEILLIFLVFFRSYYDMRKVEQDVAERFGVPNA